MKRASERYRLEIRGFDFGGSRIVLRDRGAVYGTLEDRDRRKLGLRFPSNVRGVDRPR